ncbi:MAG: hypothetical protein CME61_09680 [Halobacteriovoraceae bacterium]|nr:hypothetical protein [Halobacteriovoraceae bacterium]
MKKGFKVIEIRKAGFLNKGAQLMLFAIIEYFNKNLPDAKLVMAPTRSASYINRAKLGFYQKAHYWRKGVQFGFLANLIPSKLRDMYGIILDKEVDVVIDASGFSYSDQWGKYSCLEMLSSCVRWKKNNTKIILMPQAFGPFNSTFNKIAIKKIIGYSNLTFARDEISYNYLQEITGSLKSLKISNDFTNLLSGIVPEKFDHEFNKFCFIPNFRMIDKTNKSNKEWYLPVMIMMLKYCHLNNQKPFILVHDLESDLSIAKEMRNAVDQSINIILEQDPLKIKGIIGVSTGVIGSRYHGIISALSQGVPTLSIGWSHKYEMLFNEYDFKEGMLDINMSKEEIISKINMILDEDSKIKIKEKLKIKGDELKIQSQKMWEEVFKVIRT